ncbi:MAG: hypothetical protein ACI4XW_02665 [Candidatus Spyradocola sp.]
MRTFLSNKKTALRRLVVWDKSAVLCGGESCARAFLSNKKTVQRRLVVREKTGVCGVGGGRVRGGGA